MRSMFRVVQGLEALPRITVGLLHQAVTHRRNAAINARLNHKTKPLEIQEDHLEELRYGYFVNEKFLRGAGPRNSEQVTITARKEV